MLPEPSHFENIKVSTSFSFVTTLTSPFPPSNAQFQEPNGATLFGSLLQFLHETVSIIVTETGWPSSSAAANEFDTNLGYAEIYLKGLLICMRGGCGDRKDFFKERKHERFELLGSVARWRDSPHHRDFNRWGSVEFRRPLGHGHGYAIYRFSNDKMLEDDSRPSFSRGDGKYGRSSRENRGGPFDGSVMPSWFDILEIPVAAKFILGMLTNFGSMALDRIHNTLKTKAFKRSRSHDFLQVPNEYAYTSLSFYVHEKQPSTVQIEVLVLPLVGLWLDLQWPCLCFTL
ncbi:Anaphase-promoting complex subunit 2 [Glycine soja]